MSTGLTSHATAASSPTPSMRTRVARALVAALATLALGGTGLLAAGCSASPDTAHTGPDAPAASSSAAFSVAVTVDSSAADGSVAFSGTVELPAGATAYDALVATGLDLKASESQYGMFIESVGGLASGDHGAMSGWTYEVNDEAAMVACDAYELAEGDSVSWTYTTGA